MAKLLNLFFHRSVQVSLMILLQLVVLFVMLFRFSEHYAQFSFLGILVSAILVVRIVTNQSNPAYKIAWIIPILAFPVFGGLLYLCIGGHKMSRREKKKLLKVTREADQVLHPDQWALAQLGRENENAAGQSRYIAQASGFPVCRNTRVTYFPQGEDKLKRLVEELKKAEKYIFMEYFIISQGRIWDEILAVLEEKARAGVEVRVIYDDIGCMMTLPRNYADTLKKKGIACAVFNPFVPVISVRLNNRDHRKICVIDGKVGFTGGVNLADEYANLKVRFGHWKDTAVMLEGEGVWNLAVMFLSVWDYIHSISEDYEKYRAGWSLPESAGYVQPYSDSPLDEEPVGERVYLNMISRAKKYVYITTPYLIADNLMMNALCTAAMSGVDVRIITPHIPDKKIIFEVTRAHYPQLLEAGVRIFEYTPGFIHGKNMVTDDACATVGTINLDYRSLYLHFECGVWMHRCPAVHQVREDFLATQALSQEVFLEEATRLSWLKRIWLALLRVFAPLM